MTSAIDHTLDEYHIVSLLKRERYYRDTHNYEKMRAAYHPDSSKTFVNISWYEGDIDGFINGSEKYSKTQFDGKINTIHRIDPIEIHIRESKALAESFCVITSRLTIDNVAVDKITTCRLLSKLEKLSSSHGSTWKMLSLEPIYIRDSLVPVAPPQAGEPPLVTEGAEKWPKSYRYGAWTLEKVLGLMSRHDLPSEDDRAGLNQMFKRLHAWLDAA